MKTFSKKASIEEKTQLIPCPLCGGARFKPHWSVEEGEWHKCKTCALILQNPQPLVSDILNRYDEEYASYEQENESSFFQLMNLGLKDIDFESLIPTNPQERTFLDIGCATGRLIHSLSEKGWQSQGVEVCTSAADYGRATHGVNIFNGTIQDAQFPDNTFSFVHSSHVIEHINQPKEFLAEIYRVLKPGGYYISVTPNVRSLQVLLFKGQWRSAIADHLCLFSTKTLPRMAQDIGFEVVSSKTWGGIGKGFAPDPIKKIADKIVKPLGWGDVMIHLLKKAD